MVLNTVFQELREHGRDTTLPAWHISETRHGTLGLYTSMVIASVRYIASCGWPLSPNQSQQHCIVLAMVVAEQTRHMKIPLSDAQAVRILEWIAIYLAVCHFPAPKNL